MSPFDDRELLAIGLGVMNLVNRATADELGEDELHAGGRRLARAARRVALAEVPARSAQLVAVVAARPAPQATARYRYV